MARASAAQGLAPGSLFYLSFAAWDLSNVLCRVEARTRNHWAQRGLDRIREEWNFPGVSVTVDNESRIRLPNLLVPGEEYVPENPKPGVIVLRRRKPMDLEPRERVILETWDALGPAPEIDYDAL